MDGSSRNTNTRVSRREFLRLSALLAGLAAIKPERSLVAAPSLPKPKVVHTYCDRAADWDFSTGWYGDYVDQAAVSQMVDRGLMELTGRKSRADAWRTLIPNYESGQRVAIKANFNNARSTDDSDNVIDALIEPVNAVIAGLKELGVAESDIWVYDAVRSIPTRFQSGCDYPGVQFSGDWTSNPQGFSAAETVSFGTPPGGPTLAGQPISNVLFDADYLINMPIMKKHWAAGVTLSFKNHFGSIDNCAALHRYTFPSHDDYTSAYNPLVDIYQNRHFGAKTVLTIGDGLYASKENQESIPQEWLTLGAGAPNSLFFSQDPVAIDSVMYDFLKEEADVNPGGDDYLALAAQAGLGVHEHRASGASGPDDWYDRIDYVYVNVDSFVKLRGLWRDGTAYLYWNKPCHPDLAGYRLHYTDEVGAGAGIAGSSLIDVPDPDQHEFELTGLTMYTLYRVWIETYDGSDQSLGQSNQISILPTDILHHLPLASAG
jgi:uncharacterized protein (DUF362 family)